MSRAEILATRYGEMLDMIACLAIYNGATPKADAITAYDEAINVD